MNRKNMNFFLIVIFGVIISIAASFPVNADIYMFIDSEGILHFTNMPSSPKYKIFVKEYPAKPKKIFTTNKYDDLIKKASKKHGLSFSLIKAIIKAESDFDPNAVSKAGAMGLMQIMPKNITAFNINNPFNPSENIMGGAGYFKKMLKCFDGDIHLALAAYNAGPSTVIRYRNIPPFEETENFIDRVMKYYYIFKKG